MTGIFLYLKHVSGLLDRCYEREALLHANHIHSFAPILRFDEQLADTAQELAEHRKFVGEAFRGYLWPDRAAAAASERMRDEGRARALESGNAWDSWPTAYMRRRMEMAIQQRDHFWQMRAPYEDEQEELFREEADRFVTDLARSGEWVGVKRAEFYKAVFASRQSATGLHLDKKLSTKASPVHSKILGADWKVSIQVDGKHLNSPYNYPTEHPVSGKLQRSVFPAVEPSIAIRPLKPHGDEARRRAAFHFDWVFPIGHWYRPFADLRELETILRIYIEMFRLIEPELEAALAKEPAERGA
jgi:hypothetical protein